jgi:hypothetical protein
MDRGEESRKWGAIMNPQALNNLPLELKQLPYFVLYKHTIVDGEVEKRPYDWLGGRRGNDSPELRLTFDQALEKIGMRSDLGLAIYQPDEGIKIERDGKLLYLYIIDGDGFVAELAGKQKMLELGWELIEECKDSYAELSVSGKGLKILLLTDMKPQSKRVLKLPPNEFSEIYPEVKKYGQTHAVEVFSAKFWNILTGQIVHKDCKDLKYVPRAGLEAILDRLEGLAPQKAKSQSQRGLSAVVPKLTNLPDKLGVIAALSKIENQTEATWNEVAWCLARLLGHQGLELFICYSRGDYNGTPYAGYDDSVVRDRYRRALEEVSKRPEGYGLAHLSKLSGVDIAKIKREKNTGTQDAHVRTTLDGVTAEELSRKTFPPLQWVIEGILPEGSYMLSARPKVGKSWLALQICVGVAYGEPVLSREVKPGIAIYLALEDNHRRLQSRLRKLRPLGYDTPSLRLYTKWRRFNEGGVQDLIDLIEEHKPRLVVIDTLAKVRPTTGRNNVYESDYAALAPITEVANRFRTTVLIVHHNRKGRAETDPLEQVSGSLGLSGAVDGVLVIDGNRGDAAYTLSLIGRDIPNDEDLAISLSDGRWTLLGAAKQVFVSQERKVISELLLLHPNGLKPKEISEHIGKRANNVRKLLVSMANDGQLVNNKGVYSLPTLPPSNEGNSCSSGNSDHLGNSGNSLDSDTERECMDVQDEPCPESEELPELPQLPVGTE